MKNTKSVTEPGRAIPKALKWYQWLPCLVLSIIRQALASLFLTNIAQLTFQHSQKIIEIIIIIINKSWSRKFHFSKFQKLSVPTGKGKRIARAPMINLVLPERAVSHTFPRTVLNISCVKEIPVSNENAPPTKMTITFIVT